MILPSCMLGGGLLVSRRKKKGPQFFFRDVALFQAFYRIRMAWLAQTAFCKYNGTIKLWSTSDNGITFCSRGRDLSYMRFSQN